MSESSIALVITIAIISVFCMYIIVYTNGIFCKVFGHKGIACGWHSEGYRREDGMILETKRIATDFYCERCGCHYSKKGANSVQASGK